MTPGLSMVVATQPTPPGPPEPMIVSVERYGAFEIIDAEGE